MQIREADHATDLGERIDALSGTDLPGEERHKYEIIVSSFRKSGRLKLNIFSIYLIIFSLA